MLYWKNCLQAVVSPRASLVYKVDTICCTYFGLHKEALGGPSPQRPMIAEGCRWQQTTFGPRPSLPAWFGCSHGTETSAGAAAAAAVAEPRSPAAPGVSHRWLPLWLHGRSSQPARIPRTCGQRGESGLHDPGLSEFILPKLLHADDG